MKDRSIDGQLNRFFEGLDVGEIEMLLEGRTNIHLFDLISSHSTHTSYCQRAVLTTKLYARAHSSKSGKNDSTESYRSTSYWIDSAS